MHLNIYIFFISPYKPMPIKMKNCTIENSKSEKLLDITFGLNLSFDNNRHIYMVRPTKRFLFISLDVSW